MNTKKVIALLKANLWSLLTLVLSLGIGGGAVVWASGEREKVGIHAGRACQGRESVGWLPSGQS